MTAPFFDLSQIKTALSGLVTAKTVNEVRLLWAPDRALNSTLVRNCPTIALAPSSSTPSNQGLKSRVMADEFDVIITVEQLASNDATAWSQLAAIRAAVFALLEGAPPTGGWVPIRYQGGQSQQTQDPFYLWVDRYRTTHPFC